MVVVMTVMPAILSQLELQITLYVGTSQSHLQLHKAFLVAFAWSVPSSLSIPSCHYLRSFISSLVLCISQSCCGLFCNSLVIRLLFSQSSVGYSGWLFYILVLINSLVLEEDECSFHLLCCHLGSRVLCFK